MNLEKELSKDQSKALSLRIANYVGNDPKKFGKLMHIYLNRDFRISHRSAMVVGICVDRHPKLIEPYLSLLVENLGRPVHDAIKRNTVRVFQNIDLPEDLWGDVWDICYGYLTNPKEAVAIRVFSMTVLYNIVKKLPELKNELRIAIEDHMPYGSAGFVNRGGKILMRLEKMRSEPI